MNNYFYVDIEDEITTILGKLRKEKSEEIFLVVPKHALIAQSLVNLRLLEKEARKSQKKIIFVSPDAQTRKIAEKAGLLVKKYIARPKDNLETPVSPAGKGYTASLQKKKPLEPWEEAAAEEELKKAIGKDKPAKEPSAVVKTPTRVRAGIFGTFNSVNSVPPTALETVKTPKKPAIIGAKPQIVDLKKIVKSKSVRPKVRQKTTSPVSFFKEREKKEVGENEIQSKQTEFVEEPALKELLSPVKPPNAGSKFNLEPENSRMIGSNLRPELTMRADRRRPEPTRVKPQIAQINPFKVKKLSKSSLTSPSAVKNIVPASKISSVTAALETENSRNMGDSVPPDSGIGPSRRFEPTHSPDISSQSVQSDFPTSFERETANLTIREKERLRDLWMQQKGVIRGKTFQANSSLDLKSKEETESGKEKLVAEETGISDLLILPEFRIKKRYFYRAKHEEKIERKKAGRFINIFKKVIFYLAETNTKNITLSEEHKDYRWLCFNDAINRITFKNAKDVLIEANKHVKSA